MRFLARGRTTAGLLLLLALAAACAPPGPDANARFKQLYTAEWKWRMEQFPEDEDSQKPVQDHLPKADAAAEEARLAHWEDVLRQLKQIPRAELSAEEQQNYDIYRPQIEGLIANQRFRDYEMPVNADTSFWTNLSYTARRPFRKADEYGRWVQQMRDIPRFFHEETDQMRAGLRRGFTPPQVTITGLERSLTAVTEATPEQSLFYTPFKDMPGVPAGQQAQLRADALAVIRDQVKPAYAELLRFVREEYVPGARKTLAAAELPDGPAYYRAKIREFTTLDLEPDAIHALGEQEVARLHGEMLAVMKEAGFKGDFPAFLKFLRSDPRFYAKSGEELLMRGAWIAKQFDGKASQFFGYLPRARFAIRPVPEEMAPFYTAGRGGPGLYLLNTYKVETRPLFNLTALTLHESAPGHAMQLSIAAEHKAQPEFRQHTYISAYGEGWALYCERLGVEMGMYETAYDRFGMLGYQIWRAARLVVDTGIHAHGWSR